MFTFWNEYSKNIIMHITYYKKYIIISIQYQKSYVYHTKHQTYSYIYMKNINNFLKNLQVTYKILEEINIHVKSHKKLTNNN